MKASFLQIMKWVAIAAAVSAIVNVILFSIFHAMGIISDSILLEPAKTPMTFFPVLLASILPTLVGGLIFYLFYRFAKNGFKIFSIVSVVLLVLSFYNPFTIPAVTVSYAVALNIMHIVVAGFLLYFIKRTTQPANS